MRLSAKARERGFVLIAMSVSMFLMLAVMGLAFDIGRIYIARNEAQIFTDAAALAAVSKLDNTADGIKRAKDAVARVPDRWNLGTSEFTGVIVEFSKGETKWERTPQKPAEMIFVRVTAPANSVEITFLRAVGGPATLAVPAHSVAASGPVRLIE